MKDKTLDEKKVFVPRRIGKNEKINEVFFTYEDVKQFIKEILDEANKYLKNHGEELEKWSEGNLDIESNQWIRAWIKDYVKIIKQKSGFEELE